MGDKSLNRKSKTEILELFLAQAKEVENLKLEIEQLKEQLQHANQALEDRTIKITTAGSLAEACLSVNHIFEAAEASAAQYLENIQRLSGEYDSIFAEKEAENDKKLKELLSETTIKCDKYKQLTTKECDELKKRTLEECDALKKETIEACEKLKKRTSANCAAQIRQTKRRIAEHMETLSLHLDTPSDENTEIDEISRLLEAMKTR